MSGSCAAGLAAPSPDLIENGIGDTDLVAIIEERAGDIHHLGDRHRRRHVPAKHQLESADPQHRAQCRVDPLERPAIGQDPVDQPVDLVFLLLAPQQAGADHLKALARVSRLLRDESLCAKLRGCDTADGIYALMNETEAAAA